jgi:chromosome partitioning protein
MARPVIAVTAYKGGVGKTTLALELASALAAVLVDLDWDRGGATGTWGAPQPDPRLLNALTADRERTPRFLVRPGRPGLVPSHPDLAHVERLDPALLATRIRSWVAAWGRPVVLDTHPGAVPLTDAAWAVADLVVVPTTIGWPELRGLAGLLEERASDFPLLLAPNRVRAGTVVRPQLVELMRLAREYHVPVAPPVGEHVWLSRRRLRASLVLDSDPSPRGALAGSQFRAVADAARQAMKSLPTNPKEASAGVTLKGWKASLPLSPHPA